MEIRLLEIVHSYFPDSNIDPDNWQLVLRNALTVPSTFHLLTTVNFYVACFSKDFAVNLSMVIYYDKHAVGVLPLMAHRDERIGWVLSSNGEEIVEPIWNQSLAPKVRKKLEAKLLYLISDLSGQLNIRKCQFVNTGYFELSSWYVSCAERSQEIFATHHLLVDLSLSIEEIRLKFRNSYKPLINKGLREFKVEVCESVSNELFERFRLLHKSIAGRSTRPIESWGKQKEQIEAGESFMVTVSDDDNVLIGAGLFPYSSYCGLYCTGAYKREFFDKPLGHAVQMKAIETFKKNGLKWYEIGQKHLKIDKTQPTEKELSISFFKEGFSTRVVARQHLIIDMNLNLKVPDHS